MRGIATKLPLGRPLQCQNAPRQRHNNRTRRLHLAGQSESVRRQKLHQINKYTLCTGSGPGRNTHWYQPLVSLFSSGSSGNQNGDNDKDALIHQGLHTGGDDDDDEEEEDMVIEYVKDGTQHVKMYEFSKNFEGGSLDLLEEGDRDHDHDPGFSNYEESEDLSENVTIKKSDSDSEISSNLGPEETSDEHYQSLIQKYLDPSLKVEELSGEEDALAIKSCMNFLASRNRRMCESRVDVEKRFIDAETTTKLLDLLLRLPPRQTRTQTQTNINDHHVDDDIHTSNTLYATVYNFNTAATLWRRATTALRYFARENKDRYTRLKFQENLRWQRRNACRCLYSSEQTEKIIRKMEELSRKGHPSLRPNQYTYEVAISNWSTASGALNFMLRGEGKAAGAIGRIPTRTESLPVSKISRPWDDPSIIHKYTVTTPAKKADGILSTLMTLAELEGSEFKITSWVMRKAFLAWVQVKVKPRRFVGLEMDTNNNKNKDDNGDEYSFSPKLEEEFYVPARAEELLWNLVGMTCFGNSHQESNDKPRAAIHPNLFRAVVSSWSHSNHPHGMYHAEAILTKMGDLYEVGRLNVMPTPEIFNAVLGSWSRRGPWIPFNAPERCVAILKHCEQITDKKYLPGKDAESESGRSGDSKWSDFELNEKTYSIVFGSFRGSLNSKVIVESKDALRIAASAESLLAHVIERIRSGCGEVIPLSEAYYTVITCYGKAVKILAHEVAKEDEVLKDVGVDFMGMHDEAKIDQLMTSLNRIKSLLEEMESGDDHTISSNLDMDAYKEALTAWTVATLVPDSASEAHRILERVIQLYDEEGHKNIAPNTSMFNQVVTALLQSGSSDSVSKSSELLRTQERLHFEGTPSCRPSIVAYRSMLAACSDNPSEVSSILERMSAIYESNIVDDLQKDSGTSSVEFNEVLELWSEVDDRSKAAEWAESMLLRIAKEVYESSVRGAASTQILRTKNFNSTIRAWLEVDNILRAERILEEMERLGQHHMLQDIKPDHLSFHSIMKGWSDSKSPTGGDRVELLLDRMMTSGLMPSQVTYKLVLNAHMGSKSKSAGINKAEKILKQMGRKRFDESSSRKAVRPNTKMANMILQAWSQSLSKRKSIRAYSLLRWMKQEHSNGNPFISPSFTSYVTTMSSCVRATRDFTEEEKKRNFDILRQIFEEVAKHPTIRLANINLRIMMRGCEFLLAPGKERNHHGRAIFEYCKSRGNVDEMIFSSFCETVDKETFLEVTGLEASDAQFTDLPSEWRLRK